MRASILLTSVTLLLGMLAAASAAEHIVPLPLVAEVADVNAPSTANNQVVPASFLGEAYDKIVPGDCCPPPWAHRCGAFGEFLYLNPRSTEVTYAAVINGPAVAPPAVPIQMGRMGVADPDYSSGYRLGMSWAFDECSSAVLSYSQFATTTADTTETTPGTFVQPMLLHPSSTNAGTNALLSTANYDLRYDLVDADFRGIWTMGDCWAVNYTIGARYAHLNEDFHTLYTLAVADETVATEINFDGAGFRFGLDGERHTRCGFMVYGKGMVNFVAGEFRTRFNQSSTVDPVIVDATWRAGRLVSILDAELGAGWQSKCGRVRATAGYMISAWVNTVSTSEYMQAVRTNNFVGLDDTTTFDGFVTRLEYRF